jgi:hypothetical protein
MPPFEGFGVVARIAQGCAERLAGLHDVLGSITGSYRADSTSATAIENELMNELDVVRVNKLPGHVQGTQLSIALPDGRTGTVVGLPKGFSFGPDSRLQGHLVLDDPFKDKLGSTAENPMTLMDVPKLVYNDTADGSVVGAQFTYPMQLKGYNTLVPMRGTPGFEQVHGIYGTKPSVPWRTFE